ncbi:MAG: hypothetical protein LAN59_00715 [Acidobacteriia bacterium]|nr:hypothetical protein [Terriglobia bacterium]
MRKSVILWAAILAFAVGAGAQENSAGATLLTSAMQPALAAAAMPAADAMGSAATSRPDRREPGVYSVFERYNWQASAGYTFLRFYEIPSLTQEMNGLNLSLVYYRQGGSAGGDVEMIVGQGGPQQGYTSKFASVMGGLRYRFALSRKVEWWVHGMAGTAHFLPQTPWSSQWAFAYAGGGGVDFNAHRHRIAYRISADMIGTRFFGTYQYSPKVSVGIVYKF